MSEEIERRESNSKISVIIPVYKVEQYMDRCIQSVVDQTYRNLDIILIDDGSPDICVQKCDEWAEKDSRIRVIHQENKGLAAARNAGLDVAEGDYISFVDSDDYIAPEMMERLIAQAEKDGADVAIAGFMKVNENGDVVYNGQELSNGIVNKTYVMRHLIDERWVYTVVWNKLYRRFLWETTRFPEGKWFEDTFTMHKILYSCDRITEVSGRLYYYLKRGGSITNQHRSIRTLDNFEGYYERIRFFEEKGLREILRTSKSPVFVKFMKIRAELGLDTEEEKKRYREVRNMMKYYRNTYGSTLTLPQKVCFSMPRKYGYPEYAVRIKRKLGKVLTIKKKR